MSNRLPYRKVVSYEERRKSGYNPRRRYDHWFLVELECGHRETAKPIKDGECPRTVACRHCGPTNGRTLFGDFLHRYEGQTVTRAQLMPIIADPKLSVEYIVRCLKIYGIGLVDVTPGAAP